MEQYRENLEMVITIIQMRYNEKLNEMFNFEYNNEMYQLKPMFLDKYNKAYNIILKVRIRYERRDNTWKYGIKTE